MITNSKKHIIMKKYLITLYQVVHKDGNRDTVKPERSELVSDVELYRQSLKEQYNCKYVNLTYTEITDWEDGQ